MCLEGHEIHNLEVWDPKLGKDIDIDRSHTELVSDGSGTGNGSI